MDKMQCLFRNKDDQDIIAYLEINSKREDSFITFFRLSEEKPCFTLMGDQCWMIMSLFQKISLKDYVEFWKDKEDKEGEEGEIKDIRWYPSKEESMALEYKLKSFREEILNKKQENY